MVGYAVIPWFIRGFWEGSVLLFLVIPDYFRAEEASPWGYTLGVWQEVENLPEYTFSQRIIVFQKDGFLVQRSFL